MKNLSDIWYILVLQRIGSNATKGDNLDASAVNSSRDNTESSNLREPVRSSTSLVFGYLNLFSDGVVSYIDFLLVELKESFPCIHSKCVNIAA